MDRKRKLLLVLAALLVIIICVIAVVSIRHGQNEIKLESLVNGDYDYLSDDNVRNALERILDRQETEWVYFDLNADGKMELIFQEKNCTYISHVPHKSLKAVIGAFAVQDNEIAAVIWDLVDMGAFYFIDNDKLFYYYDYHGTYDYESYQIYQFDSDWKKQFVEGFEYFYIYDLEELPPDWLEHYPTMIQEGTYYRKYRLEDIDGTTNVIYEDLSEQQWKESLNIF